MVPGPRYCIGHEERISDRHSQLRSEKIVDPANSGSQENSTNQGFGKRICVCNRRGRDCDGRTGFDTSKKEVAARLAELVDQIRLRYTIGYKPSTSKPEGTFCKLQLQLSPDALKTRPVLRKLTVRTRQGYYR